MKKPKRTQQRLPKNFSQKMKFFVGSLIGIIGLSYLSFNDYGIVRHFQIKKELTNLQTQIETLEAQQQQIKLTIEKLQSDYDYIEKIAREKLKLVKEGEELYLIKKNTTEGKTRKH